MNSNDEKLEELRRELTALREEVAALRAYALNPTGSTRRPLENARFRDTRGEG